MAYLFEDLKVYRKAVDFADRIIEFALGYPRGSWFLIDQLRRAALSIPANIAEGNGRFTRADRKRFFAIARGSIQECVPLLEISKRRGFLTESEHDELRAALDEISRMLWGLLKAKTGA